MKPMQVYVIDDESEIRHSVAQFLDLSDIDSVQFADAATAFQTLDRNSPVVVVSDIRMPNIDGMEFLSRLNAMDATLPVILMTGHGDVQMAVSAMQKGAYDFIEKPFDPEKLLAQVRRAMALRKLTLDNRLLRSELSDPERLRKIFHGNSEAMAKIREKVLSLAQGGDHVLIRGEIGTGRVLAARAIHAASQDTSNPVHFVNCASLEEGELDSVLFSDERSFPLLRSPSPSTVVIEDIGQMSPKFQAKLCEHLTAKDNTDRPSTRIIGIETLPASAPLSENLFYHFSGTILEMVNLRERSGDILQLFTQFYRNFCADYGTDIKEIDPNSAARLMAAPWPGNIRQIKKLAESMAMNESDGSFMELLNVQFEPQSINTINAQSPLKTQVDAFEEMLIRNALTRHKGSISGVLEELSLPRRTLNEKMARYGLSRGDFT